MSSNLHSSIFTSLIFISLTLIFIYYHILSRTPSSLTSTPTNPNPFRKLQTYPCNLYDGNWELDYSRKPMYDETCPFHRNSWNCLRNKRENMVRINVWKWRPRNCVFNVTVGNHRAVLLARYQLQPKQPDGIDSDGQKGIHRVYTDIPADDWANIADFYDVLIFNTGHWWGYDKFPEDEPLVFYESGNPVSPPLDMLDGFKLVLKNMASYIQKEIPNTTLKFWQLQSPRHFHGGDWNQNGSCLFNDPLDKSELDSWFDPTNNGVNKEARLLNSIIKKTFQGTDIHLLNLSRLSEFRADAVEFWGQDCMHWCLPGLPDTWLDILASFNANFSQRFCSQAMNIFTGI